jgi:hypothetical protein
MWPEQIPKLKGPLFPARISTVAEMLKQRCRQHFIDSPPLQAPERFVVCVDGTVPVASGAWHGLVWARVLAR